MCDSMNVNMQVKKLLHAAIEQNNFDAVKFLLETANPTKNTIELAAKDSFPDSITNAAENERYSLVKFLASYL